MFVFLSLNVSTSITYSPHGTADTTCVYLRHYITNARASGAFTVRQLIINTSVDYSPGDSSS
eukprot:COSAG01_NODE_23136_length_827_cov_1.087912_1_plen_61_part_10